MNDDDIWNGYRLGNSQENIHNINYMIAMIYRLHRKLLRMVGYSYGFIETIYSAVFIAIASCLALAATFFFF